MSRLPMSKIWKKILNGFYEVSSTGDIRRLAPVVGNQSKPGRLLKGSTNKDGYNQVCLRLGPQKIFKLAHRLVAEAFLGECPADREVNHKDGNKLNNSIENLEYVTDSGNSIHAYKMGLRGRLKEPQVREIRRLAALGVPQKDIASRFNVTQSNVSNIKCGRYWNF